MFLSFSLHFSCVEREPRALSLRRRLNVFSQVCVPTSLYFRRYYLQEMKKDVKLGGYVLLEKLQT